MHTLPIKYPGDDLFGRDMRRGLLLVALALLAFSGCYYALTFRTPVQEEISQTQMFDWIKQGHVTRLQNQPDASTGIRYLTGTYEAPGTAVNFKVRVDLQLDPYLVSEIQQAGYKGTIETVNNTSIAWLVIVNLLPLVLGLLVLALVVRAALRWVSAFGKA